MAHAFVRIRKSPSSRDAKMGFAFKFESIEDLFKDPDKYVTQVGKQERFNLYYSVATHDDLKNRKVGVQEFLPFDIDHIVFGEEQEVVQAVCDVLGVDFASVLSMCSGYGVQVLVKLKDPISREDYSNGYFEHNRGGYLSYIKEINKVLKDRNLGGDADPCPFKATQLMRVPNTTNKKQGRPDRKAFVINDSCEPVEFDLFKYGKVESEVSEFKTKDGEVYAPKYLDKFDTPEVAAIIGGCLAVQRFINTNGNIPEPLWRAIASIFVNIPDGRDMFHTFSSGYHAYSKEETDRYLDSVSLKGPYRCETIESLGGDCNKCPNKGKVTCPIQIKSTKAPHPNGFRTVLLDSQGQPTKKVGEIDYMPLADYARAQFNYVSVAENAVYRYEKNKFIPWISDEIENFCYKNVKPLAKKRERLEFRQLVGTANLRVGFFDNVPKGFINCANGVIDTRKQKILPHSPEMPFRSILPFSYDPNAKCPMFDKFLKEVTCNRESLEKILLEFIGYAITNMDVIHHKALLLFGDGANGKSTFTKVIGKLFGEENTSTVGLSDIGDPNRRRKLETALINLSEESPKGLKGSEDFKLCVSGGVISVKELYKDIRDVQVRTKFIFNCNDLPKTDDVSEGLFRRLIIIPFDATFQGKADDKTLDTRLESELPGILNRVLEGYERLLKQGDFTKSEDSDLVLASYKDEANSSARWASEVNLRCTGNTDDFLPLSKTMYDSYRSYCKEHGDYHKSYKIFLTDLKRAVPKLKNNEYFARKVVDGVRIRGICGWVMDHNNPGLGDYKIQSLLHGAFDKRHDS